MPKEIDAAVWPHPHPDLTKWPRVLVLGEPVTHEQAAEINIRTAQWHFMSGNDKLLARQIAEICGYETNSIGYPAYPALDDFIARYHVLDLSYLHNHNIMSSWIGGPHGWCWWDGSLGASAWNIGKWPEIDEVEEDLIAIAMTWPFLRFTLQLIPDEGEGHVVAQWEVAEGNVSRVPLTAPLEVPRREHEPEDVVAAFVSNLRSGYRHFEQGVPLDYLRAALEHVLTQVTPTSEKETRQALGGVLTTGYSPSVTNPHPREIS